MRETDPVPDVPTDQLPAVQLIARKAGGVQ